MYPDKVEGKKTKKNKKNKKQKGGAKYKVWTASSDRDIQTAEAYIKGSFPSHQSGPDGHGDGTVVQLVKVPNKAAEWDRSLTPHVSGLPIIVIVLIETESLLKVRKSYQLEARQCLAERLC